MEIHDLRASTAITKSHLVRVTKEEDLSIRIITDTGYLIILSQMEAAMLMSILSGEKFKPAIQVVEVIGTDLEGKPLVKRSE